MYKIQVDSLLPSIVPGTPCRGWDVDRGLWSSAAGPLVAGNSGSSSPKVRTRTVMCPRAGLSSFVLLCAQSAPATHQLMPFFSSRKTRLLSPPVQPLHNAAFPSSRTLLRHLVMPLGLPSRTFNCLFPFPVLLSSPYFRWVWGDFLHIIFPITNSPLKYVLFGVFSSYSLYYFWFFKSWLYFSFQNIFPLRLFLFIPICCMISHSSLKKA